MQSGVSFALISNHAAVVVQHQDVSRYLEEFPKGVALRRPQEWAAGNLHRKDDMAGASTCRTGLFQLRKSSADRRTDASGLGSGNRRQGGVQRMTDTRPGQLH